MTYRPRRYPMSSTGTRLHPRAPHRNLVHNARSGGTYLLCAFSSGGHALLYGSREPQAYPPPGRVLRVRFGGFEVALDVLQRVPRAEVGRLDTPFPYRLYVLGRYERPPPAWKRWVRGAWSRLRSSFVTK